MSRFAPKFILALDSDFAEDAAARRGISVAENSGVEVKVAKITGFKDPDEAARGNIDSFKFDLIHAEGVWDFLIDSVMKRFNAETGEGKAKISKELVPVLSEIEDKIVQSHYANVVAEKLGVPLEAVSEQISKFAKGDAFSSLESIEKPKEAFRKEALEERFLALSFFRDPAILLKKQNIALFSDPFNIKILNELEKFMKNEKTFDLSKFSQMLPKELMDKFGKIMLSSEENEKELDLVAKELTILRIKGNLKLLTLKMREFEKKGDKDGLLHRSKINIPNSPKTLPLLIPQEMAV